MRSKISIARNIEILLFTALILYLGKALFIPLFYGLLIALILYPVCKWLEKRGINKAIAITFCLLLVAVLLACVILLVVWEVNTFIQDSPVIISKVRLVLKALEAQLLHAGFSLDLQKLWVEKLGNNFGNTLPMAIKAIFNLIFTFFLVPIYTALFLYNRNSFVRFLKLITPVTYANQLSNILHQTTITYFRYIKGMMTVYLFVGILNSIGLMALGIEHAFLFGMICAVMTIIPYVGIVISALLPISAVWLQTENIWYPIGVIAIFGFVQYLEANIIFPKVVGSQLNVNILAMLVAIIVGGIIWGVAGMILFIPFVAILKIIADNFIEWQPLSLLLGRD